MDQIVLLFTTCSFSLLGYVGCHWLHNNKASAFYVHFLLFSAGFAFLAAQMIPSSAMYQASVFLVSWGLGYFAFRYDQSSKQSEPILAEIHEQIETKKAS